MSPVPAQPKIYHITHVDNLAAIATERSLLSDATMLERDGPNVTIGMSAMKNGGLRKSRYHVIPARW